MGVPLPAWRANVLAAALALGVGWLDETGDVGETYVYEVWGLDDLGFRVVFWPLPDHQ